MSTLNTSPVAHLLTTSFWKRVLVTLGIAAAGALAVIMVLAFVPPQSNFLSGLFAPAIPSAQAFGNDSQLIVSEARRHRQQDAKTAQHGMYVRDPYGCLYMFQYVGAQLSLAQVRDDRNQPVCAR